MTEGHLDFGVKVVGGRLQSRIKDDRTDPARWIRPDKVLLSLQEASQQQVPDGETYSFLGRPGATVWSMGQTQQPGVPWLGWNTQHPTALAKIQGATTWRLRGVEGSGELFVHQTGAFGGVEKLLGTTTGWPRTLRIPPNVHAHATWSFTRPGTYRVDTRHVATLEDGRKVTSDASLFFLVGPCGDAGGGQDGGQDGGGSPDAPGAPVAPVVPGGPGAAPGAGAAPPGIGAALPPPAAPAPAPAAPRTTTCLPPAESSGGPGPAGQAPGQGTAPSAGTPVTDGHFDFGPRVEGGRLVARVKDDRTQPPAWVDPSSVTFVLGDAAEQHVPAGPTYGFLGAAGDPIWLMPQTQASGIPWLGWNTQDEGLRSAATGTVRFTLDAVSGPGRLAVYLTDSFGGVGEKVFGNIAGFPSSVEVPLNVHAHGNWAFTAPGTYRVSFTISADLASGRVSDRASLTFQVGGAAAQRSVVGPEQAAVPGRALTSNPVSRLAPVAVAIDRDNATRDVAAADDTAVPTKAAETRARDCVLPDTGADPVLSALLPVGLASVVLGAWLMVRRRPGVR
ncbi:hypothetical protein G6553_09850 [Nocardioides sp. IC4_145]|nr:hypothetical protein [Nocardioides sp. IC4_145]